ncbi:carbohydrate ABC transporter permease [Oryzibacter oryziterrae]|uniref:carbohydrate ABC transporter permease n=1 Tax=Oryzibacter oryziterrae TaxID=2766474 RepID=UPI001F32C25D|nr:carbohydrate ABC transporter permease [Oryzibacter oryziterrae]
MMDKFRWYEKLGIYCGLFVFLFYIVGPFIEGFNVSLKPLSLLFSSPYRFWPENPSLEAYQTMWVNVPLLGRYMLNSVFIGIIATMMGLLLIVPAAYALARLPVPGRYMFLNGLMMVNMFSGAVLIIPLYRMMRTFGILNTYAAMIIPGVAFIIATGVWLLRAYFLRIPKELEEAAYVDGASRLYTLRRVILPLAAPGILVVAMYCFLTVYSQQFIYALTFNSKSEYMPLAVGLHAFFGRQEVSWNELMAASFVGIAPVAIVFTLLQRYLVAGLTAGAVKQ